MSSIILLLLIVVLLAYDIESRVKISYYQQKLDSAGIKDGMKDLGLFGIIKAASK